MPDAVAGLYWVNALHQRFVERVLSKQSAFADLAGAVDAVEVALYPEAAILRVRAVLLGAEQIYRDLLDALNALYTRMVYVDTEYRAALVARELGRMSEGVVKVYEYKVRVYARATLDELERLWEELSRLVDLLVESVDLEFFADVAEAFDRLVGGLGREVAREVGEWARYLMAGRTVRPAAAARIRYVDPGSGTETFEDVDLEVGA